MAIFFTILKIIGIILICIVGLVLFIILYLLLAPFFFEVQGTIDKDMNYIIRAKVTSFLHFAQFHLNMSKDESLNMSATILGPLIKIYPKAEKDDTSSDNSQLKTDDNQREEVISAYEQSTIDSNDHDNNINTPDITNNSNNNADNDSLNKASEIQDISTDYIPRDDNDNTSSSILDRIKEILHKLNPKTLINKIKTKIKEIKTKIKDIKNKTDKIFSVLNEIDIKSLLKKIIVQFKGMIKRMRLNMRGTDLDFSLGSPDTTGQVSGVLSLFPPIYDRKVRIIPDFNDENLYFDGNLFIKGRIQLASMLYFVLVIITDSNTKKLINAIK